jgi:hypothetical protein
MPPTGLEAVAGGRNDGELIDGGAPQEGVGPCDPNREKVVRQRPTVDVDRVAPDGQRVAARAGERGEAGIELADPHRYGRLSAPLQS